MRDYVFTIAWVWANKKQCKNHQLTYTLMHLFPKALWSCLLFWNFIINSTVYSKQEHIIRSDKVDYNKDSPQPTKQSFIFCLISSISKDFIIFPWYLVFDFFPFLFVFSTFSVSGTLYFILSLIYVFIDSLPFYFFIYRVTFTLEHQLIHTQ